MSFEQPIEVPGKLASGLGPLEYASDQPPEPTLEQREVAAGFCLGLITELFAGCWLLASPTREWSVGINVALFPLPAALSSFAAAGTEAVFVTIAALQYPILGALVGWAASRGRPPYQIALAAWLGLVVMVEFVGLTK